MCLQNITVQSVTWEHSELGICPRPGAAGVVSQTAVRGGIRWLDAADLQRAGWQYRQAGVKVKDQWQVLPVLLPADDGRRVARDLTAQQGGVPKVRGYGLCGDDHLQRTWSEKKDGGLYEQKNGELIEFTQSKYTYCID